MEHKHFEKTGSNVSNEPGKNYQTFYLSREISYVDILMFDVNVNGKLYK